ncbi:MAG: radical SAM protein, partial [Thermodesulfobacteriota bacterium]
LLLAATEYKTNIFFPLFEKRIPELLTNTTDNWIGISLNYLSQALPAFALAGYLKERHPGFKLIIGGGLVTSWLRSPSWINPFTGLFDHLIAGRGEPHLLKLLGNKHSTQEYPPDFSALPLQGYLSPGLVLPYSASTGCYWNRCSFCPEKAEGNAYRKRSDAQVVEELSQLCDRHHPRLIHFLDNAVAPSLMRQLIDTPLGVDWYSFARVSSELGNQEFCKRLRQSGCVMLKLGIESGSQQVLDAMDKGIDLALVERALAALKSAGIATYVYLLFGTPAEDIDEARKTLAFTASNADAIGFLNLAVFNLPRNSAEAQSLTVHDFSSGDLHLYSDFHHPRGWERKNVRHFLSTEFKSHPAIRPILQRDPPFFTSNHAPFVLHAKQQIKETLP